MVAEGLLRFRHRFLVLVVTRFYLYCGHFWSYSVTCFKLRVPSEAHVDVFFCCHSPQISRPLLPTHRSRMHGSLPPADRICLLALLLFLLCLDVHTNVHYCTWQSPGTYRPTNSRASWYNYPTVIFVSVNHHISGDAEARSVSSVIAHEHEHYLRGPGLGIERVIPRVLNSLPSSMQVWTFQFVDASSTLNPFDLETYYTLSIYCIYSILHAIRMKMDRSFDCQLFYGNLSWP